MVVMPVVYLGDAGKNKQQNSDMIEGRKRKPMRAELFSQLPQRANETLFKRKMRKSVKHWSWNQSISYMGTEVISFHNEMQKHTPVHANCMVQWISKTYLMIIRMTRIVIWCPTTMNSIFSGLIHRSCFQMENTLSSKNVMTYSKTLGSLLLIARGSIQHLCLPQTFPMYLGMLSHKDPNDRTACSTAWTWCKIFLALAPLELAAWRHILAKARRGYRAGKTTVTVWGKQPSQSQGI